MLKHVFLALAAAVALACPAPAAAAEEDRNVAFILASMGLDAMPEGTATITSAAGARVVPAADAIREAAARAGSVELAALVASAGGDAPVAGMLGDLWIYEVGSGSCPSPTIALGTPVPFTAFHPQAWTYAGGFGIFEWHGSFGVAHGWTMKQTFTYSGGTTTIAGQSDWFCIDFFGLYILFPFLDGVFVHEESA